jgi:hypothetical protein
MIEHRDRGCNRRRMRVRHVDGAGAKLDLLGRRREPRDESYAGSDILGSVGDVLADIGFGEAEFIGQQESLAILLERKPPILVDRMDRHRKEPKLHGLLFSKGRLFVWHRTCVVHRMKTSSKSK